MTDAEYTRLKELRDKGHWTIEELWELDILYRKFYEAYLEAGGDKLFEYIP